MDAKTPTFRTAVARPRMTAPRCAAWLGAAVWLVCSPTPSHAQTTATPPTQDEQLRDQLGLGNAAGCFTLLGVDQADVDITLDDLGSQIGNELRAICGSSAVTSASSLGGGLNTLQATKTVSQFRLVRRRIDQRLERQRPRPPSRSLRSYLQAQPIAPTLTYADTPFEASGVFGEIEYEQRDRINTAYESGYESTVRGISVGLDHAWGTAVAGGWVSFTSVDADLTRSGVLIASPFVGAEDRDFRRLVDDPGVLGSVCGGLPSPGTLEQNATRVGGFIGKLFGGGGFVDASVSWSRRTHDYARGLCVIENQGQPAFAPGVAFNDLNSNGIVDAGEVQTASGRGVLFRDDDANGTLDTNEAVFDDIFAGTISGSPRLREVGFSVRTGGDLGAGGWSVGPRAILTYARATTGAFTESGRSTVATPVRPNSGNVVQRALGGPTGLELAFSEQARYSMLLDLGAELARRIDTPFGAIVPHGSAYWRHEFNDDRDILTVRMAQDLRSTPSRFSFATDAPDANTALVAAGASLLFGARFAVRAELRQLLLDDLFDARAITAQARLRF